MGPKRHPGVGSALRRNQGGWDRSTGFPVVEVRRTTAKPWSRSRTERWKDSTRAPQTEWAYRQGYLSKKDERANLPRGSSTTPLNAITLPSQASPRSVDCPERDGPRIPSDARNLSQGLRRSRHQSSVGLPTKVTRDAQKKNGIDSLEEGLVNGLHRSDCPRPEVLPTGSGTQASYS